LVFVLRNAFSSKTFLYRYSLAGVKSNILDRLKEGVLIGDGAMGTLLYERGLSLDRCVEELILKQPDMIWRVHRDYLEAGAEVIETNSFGANRWKLSKRGLEKSVSEINEKAAELAKSVADEKDAWVAGSIGPLGLKLDEARDQGVDVAAIFGEQISALLNGGVDFLMFETFSNLEELKIALGAAMKLSKGPFLCSMSFTEDGVTYEGVAMAEAFAELKKAGAHILGANCSIGPRPLVSLFKNKVQEKGVLYSAFPNAGRPEFFEGRYYYFTSPEYFAEQGVQLARQGVKLIGGCCGTKPEHIAALSRALKNQDLDQSAAVDYVVIPQPSPKEVSSKDVKQLPTLVEMVKQKTVVITEFDSPKTLALDKMMDAARALKKAGTDFMTVADNSLAILRMNCVVASHLVEKETGLRAIVHLACRDRNLIGTQSELMGMDALGLNHVLALTGDPSKVGDSPGATSVYDLNSISLLEGIRSMNAGKSFGGRDLKRETQFVSGCSFNPNVKNLDVQVKRLERKVAAGAQFVMTQPIFDRALAKATYEATKAFGIPIFVGVAPLLNSRNAEFLHNEVPGIVIPDGIRERMRNKEGDEGFQEGFVIAKELAAEVLNYFKGIYLVTPLVRYEATVALSQAIREGKL
jgi:methionine synthase / methylenetetrahydrofolate reductase(NADPH)